MGTVLPVEPSNDRHRWVVMTEACLNRTKPGDDGLIRPDKLKRLNVCVGKESIQRAMLIWDRILKAVEAGRFKLRIENEAPARTVVVVDGEELSIGIKEKTTRREHIPTPAERLEMKRYKHFHLVPKWDFLPSGKLVLTIDHLDSDGSKINQVTWTDTARKRIEDRLDAFADVLEDVVKDVKEGRERQAEWERQWREEDLCRHEAVRLRAEEENQIDTLMKQAAAWEHASSIRRFVNAVREEAIRQNGGIDPGGPLEKWIQWAEAHAHKTDPLPALVNAAFPEATTTQGGRPEVPNAGHAS